MRRLLPLLLLLTACGIGNPSSSGLCDQSRYRLVSVTGTTECIDNRTGKSVDELLCVCLEESGLQSVTAQTAAAQTPAPLPSTPRH